MVHGTPTWSFLYRHLIRDLSPRYRCVAPDHLGFGLSDRPPGWSYRPETRRAISRGSSRRSAQDLTLVVHDYGGPIGLAYALDHPENVRRLVLFNTWMWSFAGDAPSSGSPGSSAGASGAIFTSATDSRCA